MDRQASFVWECLIIGEKPLGLTLSGTCSLCVALLCGRCCVASQFSTLLSALCKARGKHELCDLLFLQVMSMGAADGASCPASSTGSKQARVHPFKRRKCDKAASSQASAAVEGAGPSTPAPDPISGATAAAAGEQAGSDTHAPAGSGGVVVSKEAPEAVKSPMAQPVALEQGLEAKPEAAHGQASGEADAHACAAEGVASIGGDPGAPSGARPHTGGWPPHLLAVAGLGLAAVGRLFVRR